MCTGYYSYAGGHTPEFVGLDDFAGQVVHPQQWPDDLDVTGKRVVVDAKVPFAAYLEAVESSDAGVHRERLAASVARQPGLAPCVLRA